MAVRAGGAEGTVALDECFADGSIGIEPEAILCPEEVGKGKGEGRRGRGVEELRGGVDEGNWAWLADVQRKSHDGEEVDFVSERRRLWRLAQLVYFSLSRPNQRLGPGVRPGCSWARLIMSVKLMSISLEHV